MTTKPLVLALLLAAAPAAFAQDTAEALRIDAADGDTLLTLQEDGDLAITGRLNTAGLLFPDGSMQTSAAFGDGSLPENDNGAIDLSDPQGVASTFGLNVIGDTVIPAEGSGVRLAWYPAEAAFRAGAATSTSWEPSTIGRYSAAFGFASVASGERSFAANRAQASGGDAAAFNSSNALGSSAASFNSGDADGPGSFAANSGDATGERASAFNTGNAIGRNSTAFGSQTEAHASGSVAMNLSTEARGVHSVAMGSRTVSQAAYSLVIGRNNVAEGDSLNWSFSDPVFVVGNGASSTSRSNALTLSKNGNLTIAGTITENSDERLKEDIVPVEDALALVQALRPVRYRFRAGTNRPEGAQLGLVAQEVQAALPELVHEGGDGYLSVSYAKLSAVLAGAVNEQQVQIDAQSEQIAVQADRIARLEAQNAALAEQAATVQAVAADLAALRAALAAPVQTAALQTND